MNIRNQRPCICGNDVKYKKCCMKDPLTMSLNNNNIQDDIVKKNNCLTDEDVKKYKKVIEDNENIIWRTSEYKSQVSLDDFSGFEEIPWVKKVEDIPDKEVVRKLNILKKFRPFFHSNCFQNSSLISLLIPDVKRVYGWYGQKIPDELSSLVVKGNHDRYKIIKGGESFSGSIVDLDKNIIYMRHSWNKVGDIHFDFTKNITSSFRMTGSKSWNQYKVFGVEDMVEIDKGLKTSLQETIEFDWFSDWKKVNCSNRLLNWRELSENIFKQLKSVTIWDRLYNEDYCFNIKSNGTSIKDRNKWMTLLKDFGFNDDKYFWKDVPSDWFHYLDNYLKELKDPHMVKKPKVDKNYQVSETSVYNLNLGT